MHPFSVLTLGIFVAGYITARWDLVTRLCELAIFAWEYGVVVSCPLELCSTPLPPTGNSSLTMEYAQTRAAKAFLVLTLVFLLIFIPVERLATREANLVRPCTTSHARRRTDKLCPASAIGRLRDIGQGTAKATGLLLTGQSALCCLLSCQDMMP